MNVCKLYIICWAKKYLLWLWISDTSSRHQNWPREDGWFDSGIFGTTRVIIDDPCKEVQEKLNSLRGEDNKTVSRQKCKFKIQIYNYWLCIFQGVSQSKEEIDDDEETATKKIINKALTEAMLEAKYEKEELEDVEPMDSEVNIHIWWMNTFITSQWE